MSEIEMIIQLGNRIELMVPVLKRIEKMLLQQTLLNKEVLNTKEAANYLGRSVSYLYKLRRKGQLNSSRPNNGGLYWERRDCYNWMLSTGQVSISGKASEEEKMAILNPGKG